MRTIINICQFASSQVKFMMHGGMAAAGCKLKKLSKCARIAKQGNP